MGSHFTTCLRNARRGLMAPPRAPPPAEEEPLVPAWPLTEEEWALAQAGGGDTGPGETLAEEETPALEPLPLPPHLWSQAQPPIAMSPAACAPVHPPRVCARPCPCCYYRISSLDENGDYTIGWRVFGGHMG